jgi:hypothetical protein
MEDVWPFYLLVNFLVYESWKNELFGISYVYAKWLGRPTPKKEFLRFYTKNSS